MVSFVPGVHTAVLPAALYRHSRVSGNPERYCIRMVLSASDRRIPAYAGMTVERRPLHPFILNSVEG